MNYKSGDMVRLVNSSSSVFVARLKSGETFVVKSVPDGDNKWITVSSNNGCPHCANVSFNLLTCQVEAAENFPEPEC